MAKKSDEFFTDELIKLRFKICDELYRPVFELEGNISKDGKYLIPDSKDVYECYCYWLKFRLLEFLAPIYKDLKVDRLDPSLLSILTSYISIKLQSWVKEQIKTTDLIRDMLVEFINDENVKQTILLDAALQKRNQTSENDES